MSQSVPFAPAVADPKLPADVHGLGRPDQAKVAVRVWAVVWGKKKLLPWCGPFVLGTKKPIGWADGLRTQLSRSLETGVAHSFY